MKKIFAIAAIAILGTGVVFAAESVGKKKKKKCTTSCCSKSAAKSSCCSKNKTAAL